MINNTARRLTSIAIGSLIYLTSYATGNDITWPVTPSRDDNRQRLESIFASPAEVPTAVYWYWLSGNVTPDGVADDVRSMKKAGITRAYIGLIGLDPGQAERGTTTIQSPEWYECLRSAMRTATEEGVEIGLFNCPGWSQSGGPWVTPEQSQRYLGTVTHEVSGGNKTAIILPRPGNMLSDVKTLAYRKLPLASISNANDSIATENITTPHNLFDGDITTTARVTSTHSTVTVTPSKPGFKLRSVTLRTADRVEGSVKVLALNNGEWLEAGEFTVNRTNTMPEVGFDLFAPTSASFNNVTGEAFRIELNLNEGCPITELTISEQATVNNYADQILAKMFQSPLPYWTDYKWPQAYACDKDATLDENDVIDLSDRLSGDTLHWDVPEGDWVIARTYMAPTGVMNGPALEGDGLGLEIDRWSKEALDNHYDSFIGEILKQIPANERRSWKYIVSDSYERGSQNFGDDFMEHFKATYGYDPTPYLLTFNGVVVGSTERTERFLWDLRRMIADRLAYDHIGALRDRANADGLKLWLEPYGHWGFPGEFLKYGGQSDEVGGEFWSEGNLGDIENRAASSVAHTYGKGICWAESFTCGLNEFGRSPRTMKQRGDRFFTEGINSTLLHLMVSQPDSKRFPGTNCPYGGEFNRKNTWYSQLDQFTDYLKRTGYMLQQGNYVADIAYFIGEDAPVMTGITDPALPAGYQYDFINAEVIEKTLEANENHILSLPHGTTYRLLVLPPSDTMRPQLLRKLKQLVADGAIILGPKPLRSPSLQDLGTADAEVRAIADELWGPGEIPAPGVHTFGKGLVLTGMEMTQVLDLLNIPPDFSHTAGSNADIKYAHMTTPQRDIYFVANQMGTECDFTAFFRDAKGRRPELWIPANGSHRDLPEFTHINRNTAVPLKLAQMETAFIVFERDATATCTGTNYPDAIDSLSIDTPWNVELIPMVGKSKRISMKQLADLSTSNDDYIKHFSGTALYTTKFKLRELPAGQHVELDLGDLREMARVRVNGTEAGGVWTAPYTVDISGMLKKGNNTIEIEVVNTWVNKLIGDSRLPETERETWSFFRTHGPETPLQSSGLLRPIKIKTY